MNNMSLLNEKQKELLKLIRQDLYEATTSSLSSGKFTVPLSPGIRLFNKQQMQPFVVPTSHYDDAELAYDSYDGSLSVSKTKAKKMEDKARKTSKYIKSHPSNNDDDGDILNQSPGKINESKEESLGSLIKSIYPIIIKTAGIEKRSGRYLSVDDAKKDIIKKIKNGNDEVFDLLRSKSGGMYKEKFIADIDLLRKMIKHNINESKTDEINDILITISPIIKKLINIESNRIMSSGDWMDESRIEKIILKKILSGDNEILDRLYEKGTGSHMRNEINRLRKILKNKSLNEVSSSTTSGEYSGPIEIGLKKWRKHELTPFTEFSIHPANKKKKQKTMKNNVKRNVGIWEKGSDGKYEIPTHDVHTIKEDLAVWFGTKKKPKGSKQPKGPWVNICRKVNGKHPPCGRPEASDKGYPKCRAVGVAGRMSDSQKKAACAQKRRVEKTHSKSGTGNSPKMASYKPRKEEKIDEIVNKVLNRLNNNVL